MLLTKRVRFMRLLARLADRPAVFPLHPGIDCVTESDQHPALSFWLRLLRALAPDFVMDSTKELERNLAALSHGRALRILINVEDLSQEGMAQSLALFLNAMAQEGDRSGDEAYTRALEICGLTGTPPRALRPVEVAVRFASGSVSRAVMETILGGLASTYQSATFRLCCLRFSPSCVLTESAVVLLGERVGQLSLDTLQLGSTRDVESLSLRQTVATAAATVRRFVLGDRDRSMSTIGSALRGNVMPSIRELELEFCATLAFAEWLAFAVFHVDSPAHVSSLCLRFSESGGWPTRAWITRFKEVLCGAVLPETHCIVRATRVRRFVMVAAGTVVTFSPYEREETSTELTDVDAEREYEALEEAGGKLSIVVPGVGWVLATAVQHSRTEASRLGQVGVDHTASLPIKQCVTSLALCGAPFSRPITRENYQSVLVELLAIVGAPLQRLALPDMDLDNRHMASILRSCPGLTELNMSHNLRCDLSPIVNAHARGRLSKLASLSMLQRVLVAFEAARAVGPQLMHWLKSGHTLSPLRRVAIHHEPPLFLPADEPRPFVNGELVSPASCLQAADEFEYVELHVSVFCMPSIPATIQRLTERRYATLPLRSKLALLSVAQTEGSPLSRLDASVLRLVLQFCRSTRVFLLTSSA